MLILLIFLNVAQQRTIGQMKQCLTYVLAYNSDCYSQFETCLMSQKCQSIYLQGRVQCEYLFQYDTDVYQPYCVKQLYDKITNKDVIQLNYTQL
ncbi:hypothetical protein pb186bvf_008879 [Paramecium bursaria]